MKLLMTFLFFLASPVLAALPPQFSECQRLDNNTSLPPADLIALSQAHSITYCQNQISLVGKAEIIQLLQAKARVGISMARTNFTLTDFVEMAAAGSYVLFVDSPKLAVTDLQTLNTSGVQLVIQSGPSALSKADLVLLASQRPFVWEVNSTVVPTDITDLLNMGVQVVLRATSAGLSPATVSQIARANPTMIEIYP